MCRLISSHFSSPMSSSLEPSFRKMTVLCNGVAAGWDHSSDAFVYATALHLQAVLQSPPHRPLAAQSPHSKHHSPMSPHRPKALATVRTSFMLSLVNAIWVSRGNRGEVLVTTSLLLVTCSRVRRCVRVWGGVVEGGQWGVSAHRPTCCPHHRIFQHPRRNSPRHIHMPTHAYVCIRTRMLIQMRLPTDASVRGA